MKNFKNFVFFDEQKRINKLNCEQWTQNSSIQRTSNNFLLILLDIPVVETNGEATSSRLQWNPTNWLKTKTDKQSGSKELKLNADPYPNKVVLWNCSPIFFFFLFSTLLNWNTEVSELL